MKPLPITFSHLDKIETCPKQFYHLRVIKDVREETTEAAAWGNRVHKEIEEYFRDGKGLSPELGYLSPLLSGIPRAAKPELRLALDASLRGAPFFSNGGIEPWMRGIIDIFYTQGKKARILDWKTGKRKVTDQLALSALLVFYNYPEIDEIRADFVWIKEGKIDTEEYRRDDIPTLWKKFIPRITEYKDAFSKDVWPERPSGLCRGWCPVKKCRFWSPKRQ
jgi:hypothetical protein